MLTVELELIAQYVVTGRVYYVFRPVLNHGERSLRTSEAAACAGEQGRFWPMHELLFTRQDELFRTPEGELPALMTAYATELGLDSNAFAACVAGGEALALVQALDAEQRARGIRVQPVFEIGAERLIGLQSLATFQSIIDALP